LETIDTGFAVDVGSSDHTHIRSFQDGHFWANSASGGGKTVQRIDPSFPRDPDPPNKLNLDALAWDDSHLWLSGTNDEDICQLLKVDSDSEPDSLVSLFRIRSYKVYRRRFRGNLQSYPGRPFGTGVEKSGVS